MAPVALAAPDPDEPNRPPDVTYENFRTHYLGHLADAATTLAAGLTMPARLADALAAAGRVN